ncbi:MAG: hypothetical protein HKN16_07595 [Saprospiraceae bacterium]|nr:hypothetical protein [Saprospiraceae bacterium]
MAENGKSLGPEVNLGDLGLIRNILVGPQMEALQKRLDDLEAIVSENATSFEKRIGAAEKNGNKSVQTLQKTTDTNFEKLEKLIEKKVEQLNKRLDDSCDKERARIGKLLSDVGKKLLDS